MGSYRSARVRWACKPFASAHRVLLLVSDRWSGYAWYDAGLRQVCWAHLTRDFQGFVDRGGKGGRLGKKLMRQRNLFFIWYHRVRDGILCRH
jgi:transposase